ncbi:MAG: GNAT family N-acetyltransferase [Flavobacteriaceae bacterium]|nr:GNAT family N-acetyltransferase [Flavobacteriaceae bacterium]
MTLKYLELHTDQAKLYTEALDILGDNHPYYKTEFLDIFYGGLDRAKALIAYNSDDKPLAVMPFYLREIEQAPSYFDVISTWGYSGPKFDRELTLEDKREFWIAVDAWYHKHNIVSEFIRFKLNANHEGYTGFLVEGMHNIMGMIQDPEIIWKNYNRKVRKNINRALRENLKVDFFYKSISKKIFDDFYAIFVHTMDRTQARTSYYYSYEKLWAYIQANPENCAIVLTLKDNKPIASEMILISNSKVYSFVGGTLSDYFGLRPNEILKHRIIEWAFENNRKYFVLGGGYGTDDGIFKYKQAFFPADVCDYRMGRKIIDSEVYFKLSGIQKEDYNIEQDYFPLYRKENQGVL